MKLHEGGSLLAVATQIIPFTSLFCFRKPPGPIEPRRPAVTSDPLQDPSSHLRSMPGLRGWADLEGYREKPLVSHRGSAGNSDHYRSPPHPPVAESTPHRAPWSPSGPESGFISPPPVASGAGSAARRTAQHFTEEGGVLSRSPYSSEADVIIPNLDQLPPNTDSIAVAAVR
jgi:hypothetical protein